jgi:hypothetical protein
MANTEKMITDKIHNQFLSQAQVWSGTAKQDNFFNEVNTEDANNTFDKLAMNLTVKLQDIKGIADKPTPDIQSGKKVLDNGAILTEWNTLAKIIISPKTKSEVAETLKNKLYSLEDVINKICYDYTVFIKQFTDTKPKTFALQHINQLISSLGIFLVMQKQLLSKTLSEITYNQIKDFMSFDTVRKILSNATVGTSWIASFARDSAEIIGWRPTNTDDRLKLVEKIISMYAPTITEKASIATTKRRFTRQLRKEERERTPLPIPSGDANLVFNDSSLDVLNPIYASAIELASRIPPAQEEVRYTPKELVQMSVRDRWNPHAMPQLLKLSEDENTKAVDVAAKYAGYIAKYDVANNDNSTLIADRTAIMQDILNKYNELLKYTPAEVQAKRENLANGLLLSLYGANPRTARVPEVQRERRIRFLKALENAQKLETNFMNQNYNDRVERIINLI